MGQPRLESPLRFQPNEPIVIKSLFAATVIAGILTFSAPANAQVGLDAGSLFREGNSLAKSGLYHAALLRYREAAAAGVDSSIYHYNIGVVYYRLGRYAEASEQLRIASLDPDLAAIATYNLGLVELANDNDADAALAFQSVVTMGADRELRRSARAMLARLERTNQALANESGAAANARRDRTDDTPGDLRLRTMARYAQDSNVYRAPSSPYVDLSDPTLPTVSPVVYSATYMPIDIMAAYVLPNEAEDTEFIFSYTLNGDFYDSEFSNADRVSQRFAIGADIDLPANEGGRRWLDSAFYVRSHDEVNFNPDDGLARIQADYTHDIGRWLYGFDLQYERRQYEDSGLLPNYDHDYLDNRLFLSYSITPRTELGLKLSRLRRVYDERRARDLTGALSQGLDFVEYDYRGVSAQTYDFPNALAFNNPLAARRSIDTSRTDLQLEYAFSGSLALWIALESESTTSTDLREAFDRSIATVGIKWRRH
jgi:hypothetical protein